MDVWGRTRLTSVARAGPGGGKDGDVLDRNEPDAGAVAAGDAEVRIVSASTDAARRVADTLRHRLADGQRCG
ncbi:hypothetical protein ACFWF9_16595 [Streptomyces roseolus]|uniref:hypothetical protein n=1 Tax=Streptomyces TaxID=1883 RepID=UPI003662629C